MKAPIFSLLALAATTAWSGAAVKPNPLFSHGAVLQQGVEVPVWGTANAGEKVTVEFAGQSVETTADKEGSWSVRLQPLQAGGGPATLKISGENTLSINNVLVGEVWVCSGQSNMAWALKQAANGEAEIPLARYPNIRRFIVPHKRSLQPTAGAAGKWVEISPATAGGFSAVGYFFARDLHKARGVPVGMIQSAVGGTPAQAWTSFSGLEKEPAFHNYMKEVATLAAAYSAASAVYPETLAQYQEKLKTWEAEYGAAYQRAVQEWLAQTRKAEAEKRPAPPRPQLAKPRPVAPVPPEGRSGTATVLYNGMIAPVVPFAIKGVIWYQGEANNSKAAEYRTLFPRLIADWREKWSQGDFPFLFVQIAPHQRMTPELREAQLLSWLKTKNTAMAVTTDVGEAKEIHPGRKEPVGARLALAARAVAYGEPIEYSGPLFDRLKIEGGSALLTFKHIGGGLEARGGELKGFTLAGADKEFVPAKAEIRGDTVVVSAPQVPQPVAVRYGWAKVPDVNLYNREGLPASPFRTDAE